MQIHQQLADLLHAIDNLPESRKYDRDRPHIQQAWAIALDLVTQDPDLRLRRIAMQAEGSLRVLENRVAEVQASLARGVIDSASSLGQIAAQATANLAEYDGAVNALAGQMIAEHRAHNAARGEVDA